MAVERKYLIHPHYIMMFLSIAGITALFLGFSGAYLYNRIQQDIDPVQLPSLFYFNTVLIVGSSLALMKAKKAYFDDDTELYKKSLIFTLILTLGFLAAQILAWKQLVDSDILLNYSTLASYMYLISGLHFLHLIAGIPFLAGFIYVAYKKMKTPVTVFLYFADVDKKRKLDLLNIYWHFLDGLWIYLVLFFLANYLI
ncbi:MAG: cytochrome c oxidase subunit 3 [Saprospiraceae bacterium]|nr:cytochrome c oxidase subunit 3 [Saprospiraceae bacterium]